MVPNSGFQSLAPYVAFLPSSSWCSRLILDLSHIELAFSSLFYQFSLYTAIRLAHRGFTLGELGLVSFGGTALCMEFLNFTKARVRTLYTLFFESLTKFEQIWPITTLVIKTYRLPTPLLIFQMALIAGSFVTGVLLSPFLVLSRRIAQQPVRRLRFPQEKQRYRRSLALAFYIGSVLIVGGVIGMWTRWCLGKRDPWLWVVFYILEGRRKWSRPVLLGYWASMGCISVAGWNRQLARSRRYRARGTVGENLIVPGVLDVPSPQATADSVGIPTPPSPQPPAATSNTTLGMTLPTLPNLPNAADVSNVATDLLDAADKHVPTLGLNARRKFFHALAVVMFIPGVALDVGALLSGKYIWMTHLCSSQRSHIFRSVRHLRCSRSQSMCGILRYTLSVLRFTCS